MSDSLSADPKLSGDLSRERVLYDACHRYVKEYTQTWGHEPPAVDTFIAGVEWARRNIAELLS